MFTSTRSSASARRRRCALPVAVLMSGSLLAVVPAHAAQAGAPAGTAARGSTEEAHGLPGFDRRFAGVRVPPTAAQLAAVRSLGDVEVGWTELGTPHSLRAREGALTAPSQAPADQIARGFLTANAALFRQQAADIRALQLSMLDHDKSGATLLRYEQRHAGRPVHGASMLVALDQLGQVRLVGGTLAPSLGAPRPPVVSADLAVTRVGEIVGLRGSKPAPKRQGLPVGAQQRTRFANTLAVPDLRTARPIEADLVTVPAATGGRTAWRVRTEIAANADYESLVDATTGEVLFVQNQWSHSDPEGNVFTGDDPEGPPTTQSTQPFSGMGRLWVDAGTVTTSGNNVNAYQDLFDDNAAVAADQPQTPASGEPGHQHFAYAFTDTWGTSGGTSIATDTDNQADRNATVTQMFFYTNWFHDYAYDLGFTESARNFQADNFGQGGTGGDAVQAESDNGYGTGTEMLCTRDGSAILCRNNANFNTNGPDGSAPRMQMFVGDDGRFTQRAMNRDTIIHEYAHGITGRIISNTNLQGGVQSGALGEGWSDAFATSINNDPVYGEYNNGDYVNGIRFLPYDGDNLEYGDLCNNGGSDPCQVHDDGRIWAMAMWEQRQALIGKYGFDAGKALHEDYLMLGIKLTPDTPSFHDARTGYLAADVFTNLFGDKNQCLIWRVFADNELGQTAAPDDDNDSTPTVSTDTPDDCDPVATITGNLTRPEGTDVALSGSTSVANGDGGDTLSYAWDLDNDGQYDDSTSPTPTFPDVGNDGSFPISLQVTNTAGYVDTADATITITNVAPTFSSLSTDGPKPEGSVVTLSGVLRDAGWEDDLSVTVDWKDGTPLQSVGGTEENVRPDATLGFSAQHVYGDNGSYAVTVCGADDDTSTCVDVPTSVTNVAPTITIDPDQLTERVEGQSLTVSATFSDPGWLDTYPQHSIDPGTDYLPAEPGILSVQHGDPGPGPDTGTLAATVTYGDNGTFTVTTSISDDDGGTGTDTVNVVVANVAPTATIDETGTVDVNGTPTFFADQGETLPLSGEVTDPGSDDVTTTWDFDDGTPLDPVQWLVDPPSTDLLPSPDVNARDITTNTSHAWADACVYDVVLRAADDDAGVGTDLVKILITGTPTLTRGSGYWQTAYQGTGGAGFTEEQLLCYLEIAAYLSNVFNEVRDASTIAKAYDDIFVAGKRGSMEQQLDRELLAGWVNFANGGVEYTELLDTDGDKVADTSFIDVMTAAEAVRTSATSTREQLRAKKNLLAAINERDRV